MIPVASQIFLVVGGLQVDPFTSVSAAHAIGENVRHHIHKVHPEVTEVFIHIGMMHHSVSPSASFLFPFHFR